MPWPQLCRYFAVGEISLPWPHRVIYKSEILTKSKQTDAWTLRFGLGVDVRSHDPTQPPHNCSAIHM